MLTHLPLHAVHTLHHLQDVEHPSHPGDKALPQPICPLVGPRNNIEKVGDVIQAVEPSLELILLLVLQHQDPLLLHTLLQQVDEALEHPGEGIAVLHQVQGQGGHGEDLHAQGHDGGLPLLVVHDIAVHDARVVGGEQAGQLLLAIIVLHESLNHEAGPQVPRLLPRVGVIEEERLGQRVEILLVLCVHVRPTTD